MSVEEGLLDALKIVHRIPTAYILGMVVLLLSKESWRQWVVHQPFERREERTGVSTDFAGLTPDFLAIPVSLLTGLSVYFAGSFALVLWVGGATLVTGSTPAYEGAFYLIAALAVLVTSAVQVWLPHRIRTFFAWGV